ncbi:MAG TPA: ferrochelatase [bacterium]|nr:ferrochelatase [bacterium]
MTSVSANGSSPPTRPAVVLLNFGGPRNLEEVPGFLFEILRDPNTIQLPFPQWAQDLLAGRIARRRSHEVTRQYAAIGGSSPIVPATLRIRNALADALREAGCPLPVYVAQRYLPGDAEATVQVLLADGVDAIFAVPLYPHFSYATSGSSFEQLADLLAAAGWEGRLDALRSYPDAPGLLEAMAERLEATLREKGLQPEGTVILCSAHGLPRVYVDQGDPYRLELYRTMEGLRLRFPQWRFDLSFQSRVGPAEWLKPYTDQYVPQLAAEGVRDLVFVPISFVNDHIETNYEVGVTYFELARAHGLTPHRALAVEDHPAHIRVLADAAAQWAAGRAGVPLTELLPSDQHFARVGRWAWGLWLVALFAALLFALT